jgi:hypothetical protein
MEASKHLLIIGTLLVSLSACTTTVRERVVVRTPVVQMDARPMPAPVREEISRQPGPDYAWVQGHWAWRGDAWAWQAGHWRVGPARPMPTLIVEEYIAPPSPAHYWVAGHWVWRDNDWAWVRGHWRR